MLVTPIVATWAWHGGNTLHQLSHERSSSCPTSRLFATAVESSPKPIDPSDWPDRFPAKNLCSKCGLCETSFVANVSSACAFLGGAMQRNIEQYEPVVHGRARNLHDMIWSDKDRVEQQQQHKADEGRFGVMHRPMLLARGVDIPNAQWTGCVTAIAKSMLETEQVDAVVCVASTSPQEWSSPQPILARTVEQVMQGRGVKPSLSPNLNLLDQIKNDDSVKRLLFCGVGCAVQAFRAVQHDLGLQKVFVLGTNCADNSPTPQAAQNFIRNGLGLDQEEQHNTVLGYEFMQDFKVHVKLKPPSTSTTPTTAPNNNQEPSYTPNYLKIPYFCLPKSIARQAIADSCLSCFDYTNALADVVVGYMAAPTGTSATGMHEMMQSVTIRNTRGWDMVQTALENNALEVLGEVEGEGRHESMAMATVQSDAIVQDLTASLAATEATAAAAAQEAWALSDSNKGTSKEKEQRGMPRILGEMMAFGMTQLGPKGINFARYSMDYHILRNYLFVLDQWGEERVLQSVPKYALEIVEKYLQREEDSRGGGGLKAMREAILSKKNNKM